MKKLYFLDEEEKNRILNLHESATKRQYLGEQAVTSGWSPDPTGNKTWEYQFKNGKWFARKIGQTKEYDISANTKYANSVKILNDKYPEAIKSVTTTTTNTTPVENTTKQIQALLGLEQTGVMDSGLLQKINDKLNGSGTASAPAAATGTPAAATGTPAAATGTPAAATGTPAFNFNIDPNLGKGGINFNQMTPEEKVQGVQSATPPQEPIAVTTPPTNKEKRQERRDLKKANRAELQALKDKQRGNQ